MTLGIDHLWSSRSSLLTLTHTHPHTPTQTYLGEMSVYVCFTLVVTLVGVCVCTLLDPTADAAGSGLPLLKYILSGEVMEEAEEHLKVCVCVCV
jgi:hypothetical protein